MAGSSFCEDHSGCLGCSKVFHDSDLNDGWCSECHQERLRRNRLIMSRADDRALAEVSKRVLAGLASVNKGEPTSPAILESTIRELGGVDEVGRMIALARRKASGADLTPEQREAGMKASPSLAFKYDELIVRLSLKNDERESLEISNLTDDELRNTLKGLTNEILSESEEYRKLMLKEIIKKQPDLIHEAMNEAGVPLLDGESKEITSEDVLEAGLDDKWEDD